MWTSNNRVALRGNVALRVAVSASPKRVQRRTTFSRAISTGISQRSLGMYHRSDVLICNSVRVVRTFAINCGPAKAFQEGVPRMSLYGPKQLRH
jgi:hypothetical protein